MTRQYPLPLPHREAMEADDYLVTASNREAAAQVTAWPEWPSHGLMILGPSGSGKTHLLNLWLQRSRGKLVTAEELAGKDAGQLTMSNANIAVDDAERIAGNRAAEETLFHLYNLLRETKGFLLLAAARPPAQWAPGLADLRSRLLASPVAAIGAPDDELLTMLLVKQFHDRQIDIGGDVVAYLLPRIERTTAALRRVVAELDRASLAEGRGVTVALARRLVGDGG
jgi:DnaA regulatory inactivator Hda